jgi:excisionase family DNA binding protein
MEERKVLTPLEVAEQLRCHRKTVYKMLHENKLPFIKVGDMFLIPVSAFEHYLANAGCPASK